MTWDIVGMSAVCSLADSVTGIHEALCSGRSGLAPMSAFDSSKYRAQSAYEIATGPAPTWMSRCGRRAGGARVLARQCDISVAGQAEELVSETEAELGPLATVVANAGVVRDRPLANAMGFRAKRH